MDSPPTSERLWWFVDGSGLSIEAPTEWSPAFIEVDVDTEAWESVEARIQGLPAPVQVRRVGGRGVVVVPWERAPAGRFRIEVLAAHRRDQRDVTVAPAKISQTELESIVVDLETRLAPTIALAMQRMGAFAGLEINPPGETTLAAEMHRVRVAVQGDAGTRGLISLVPEIAQDPHRMLRTDEPWVRTEAARRPSAPRLAAALAKPNNLDADRRPLAVADRRAEHTFDVYENRLLKLFLSRLDARLRRLLNVASDLKKASIADDAADLLRDVRATSRAARFLEDVARPSHGPTQVSMVLLKRPDYREMLLAYQRYQRHMTVLIDDLLLDAPLSDVPSLYELWGTMKTAEALVAVADELGFKIDANELVRRRGGDLRLVTRGASVRLTHPQSGVRVRFREQPAYTSGVGLHSITFQQIPDIALEVTRPGLPAEVVVFDPKYKLQPPPASESDEDEEVEVFPGGPKKVDIDKMHAYRDAIRRADGSRAVKYAAILYPGAERSFTSGLEAIQCRPSRSSELESKLRSLLGSWLTDPARAGSG